MTMESTCRDGENPQPGETAAVHLRLYYAGGSPYSARAEAALRKACADLPEGRVSIELLDVNDNPRASLEHNVFVTPTLIRLQPEPVVRTTGPFDEATLKRIIFESA